MGERTAFTHCLICEQLCGLEVAVEQGKIVSIRPDKQNHYTWRDFCVKGQRAHEVASSPWRVRAPMNATGWSATPISTRSAPSRA